MLTTAGPLVIRSRIYLMSVSNGAKFHDGGVTSCPRATTRLPWCPRLFIFRNMKYCCAHGKIGWHGTGLVEDAFR